MFNFLKMFKKKLPINIGVGDNIDPKKRDGVIWCTADNGITTKSFIVDKPELLVTHEPHIIESIFEQVLKLGLLPQYIEVFSNGYCRMYKYGYSSTPAYVGII